MAINEKLTLRVRQLLEEAGVEEVQEKKMFRGIAFLVNGKLCLSTGNEELMCRIDPVRHEESLLKEGVRTVIMKGKPYKGYIYVHEQQLKTKAQLKRWISLALAFNPKATTSKKQKKK